MTKPSFTPGPWFLHADSDLSGEVYFKHSNGKEYEIARAATGYSDDKLANARLIAAAPDLLEALKDLVGSKDMNENAQCFFCGRDYRGELPSDFICGADDCAGTIARAAIAKATEGK
jgi:hypothetical protein